MTMSLFNVRGSSLITIYFDSISQLIREKIVNTIMIEHSKFTIYIDWFLIWILEDKQRKTMKRMRETRTASFEFLGSILNFRTSLESCPMRPV